MTVDQICKVCGKVFQRSLYHPQIKVCPACKASNTSGDCVTCPFSKKQEWDLVCMKTDKVVTNGGICPR